MDLQTKNIKQAEFIEHLRNALKKNKEFAVTNVGGSDDTLDPVG